MKLSAGPDLKAFPVPKAVAHWYSIRRRRLGRLYQPAKRTCSLTKNVNTSLGSLNLDQPEVPEPQETEESELNLDADFMFGFDDNSA